MHLTPNLLIQAYAAGFFPMAETRGGNRLHWLSPEKRGVLPLAQFSPSRRLLRTFRGDSFFCTLNQAPRSVIQQCATAHGDTWINDEIEQLYGGMAESGLVHSVEVWEGAPVDSPVDNPAGNQKKLVGGLYGLALGGAFFGESMFSLVRDASKIALVELVLRLRHGGFTLLDVQFLTPHLASLGAVEISRAQYQKQLSSALSSVASLTRPFSDEERSQFLNEIKG